MFNPEWYDVSGQHVGRYWPAGHARDGVFGDHGKCWHCGDPVFMVRGKAALYESGFARFYGAWIQEAASARELTQHYGDVSEWLPAFETLAALNGGVLNIGYVKHFSHYPLTEQSSPFTVNCWLRRRDDSAGEMESDYAAEIEQFPSLESVVRVIADAAGAGWSSDRVRYGSNFISDYSYRGAECEHMDTRIITAEKYALQSGAGANTMHAAYTFADHYIPLMHRDASALPVDALKRDIERRLLFGDARALAELKAPVTSDRFKDVRRLSNCALDNLFVVGRYRMYGGYESYLMLPIVAWDARDCPAAPLARTAMRYRDLMAAARAWKA